MINKFLTIAVLLLFNATLLYSQETDYKEVASNDCGVTDAQSFLISGENYTFSSNKKVNEKTLTCNFGNKVIYAFKGIDINADYLMEVVYYSDAERRLTVSADGNTIQEVVELEKDKEKRYKIKLPRKAYAYGELVLVFEKISGANAVVSELNIYSTNHKKLTPFDPAKKSSIANAKKFNDIDTLVSAEKVMPQYTPIPKITNGVYANNISLNGMWQFCPDTTGNSWNEIVVPGQWNMQGYKVDSASFGMYRRNFTIPQDWNGNAIKIRFDGVSSESIIYINDKEVNRHLGGMTAFETDITDVVRKGNNTILVKVRSESLADMLGSLTQYAAHQIGGITRKVTLFTVPKLHISDVRIETIFDKDYIDATLKIHLNVKNNSSKEMSFNISSSLKDIKHDNIKTSLKSIKAGDSEYITLSTTIKNPLKWDNEHPNLYNLNIDLFNDKTLIENIEKRFGFRDIKVSGNRLLVNGVPVKLRGVCHHEINPITGRVLTIDLLRKDAELYLQGNCNFIRTSHYPPCEEFVDICDELGIFLEVEAPIGWLGHGANVNWQKLNYKDKKYYDYVLQANMETIHFYRNHPSIIFWSMANESVWNREFAQVSEYVKKADTTRPYTFHDQSYGGYNNEGSTAPLANMHYPGPEGHKEAVKDSRPMTFGEYCHLNVYNRRELVTDPGIRCDWVLALQPMWENMYNTDAVLGGSLWSGIDDIFQLPNGEAVGYGAWGPIDSWRRTKPEYWDMKKVYSPIRILTKSLQPAEKFTIEVENRHTYTNMEEILISWKYGDQTGSCSADIAPSKKGTIAIAPTKASSENSIYVSFRDRRGFIIDDYIIPIGEQKQNSVSIPKKKETSVKDEKTQYTITGENFLCVVNKEDGQIKSLKINNNNVITGGPHLMVLPHEGGGCLPNHNAETPAFNDLCSNRKITGISSSKSGSDVIVKVKVSYKEFEGEYALNLNASGELNIDYSFTALENVNPRQWGMVFESPQKLNMLFWRRNAIWSTYPENHIGRTQGETSLSIDKDYANTNPRQEPSQSWDKDSNSLGSNDFRSTKRDIYYAGLQQSGVAKITAISNGSQHWRSWANEDKVCFLVADFITPGSEMFLNSYNRKYQKPIKKGDIISGKIQLLSESVSSAI